MVVHVPPLQNPDAQATLQRPQLAGLFATSVSQPFSASPSHSATPFAQGGLPHTPFQQAPSRQASPHPPQAVASVCGFWQMPSQHDQPEGQVSLVTQPGVQTASLQTVPGEQLASLTQLMQSPRRGSHVRLSQSPSS
jgi:hypothetical protein